MAGRIPPSARDAHAHAPRPATGGAFVVVQSAVLAASSGDATVPEWVHLIPSGTFRGRDGRGPFTCDPERVIAATRRYHGRADIPIDYDHQLVFTRENGAGAPAAGWIKELEARPDGVWGRVEWTPRAHQKIAAGEYRYLSPVIPVDDKTGAVLHLLAAGLVNSPNLDLAALHAAFSTLDTGDRPTMDPELLELLGLAPDATPEQITAHCRALVSQSKAFTTIAQAFGLAEDATPDTVATTVSAHVAGIAAATGLAKDAGPEAVKAKVAELAAAASAHAAGTPDPSRWVPKAAFDELAERVAGLEKASAEEAAHSAVAAAMQAGKVSPALKDWAHGYALKDPEGFKAWAEKAPVLVAPGAAAAAVPAADGDGLDAEAAHVARTLGLTPEEFKKARDEETAR